MRLLHILSSPRKERSASLQIANCFVQAWTACHKGSDVDTLNVWEIDLLPFDGSALEAKYAGLAGIWLTAEQKAVWEQIESLATRFHAADVILFSVPMWNFGIPYRLKHLIDMVSQKDVLFRFDQDGLRGMLKGRKVVVAAARGVAWGEDYPLEDFDHQIAYMRTWAQMCGVCDADFSSVLVARTLTGPSGDLPSMERAKNEAVELAAQLRWFLRYFAAASPLPH